MFKRFSFLFEKTKPVRINYPAYYSLRNSFWNKVPFAPRILAAVSYFFPSMRKKLSDIKVNERIVELPVVFQIIDKPKSKILDVGCNESLLSLHLASLGHEVTALDINPYEFAHPNLKFIQADVNEIDLPTNHFDYVIFLSTLEHIGLGVYGEEGGAEGDKRAVQKARDVLKKRGKLILTVPFGAQEISPTQRIYSSNQIRKLLNGFKLKKSFYFKGENQVMWQPVVVSELERLSSRAFTQGACILIAEKK